MVAHPATQAVYFAILFRSAYEEAALLSERSLHQRLDSAELGLMG